MCKLTPIVNLHCHSTASALNTIDGMISVKELAEYAKKSGSNAIAITDHGNIANHIEFWEACDKEGVKPILGCEFYMVPDVATQKEDGLKKGKASHITVLAKNKTGWTNLIKLTTLANNPDHFYYEPRISLIDLIAHKEGLIVFSGCPQSMISQAILNNSADEADALSAMFVKEFGDDFYFETQDAKIRDEDLDQAVLNREIRKLAKKHGRPSVFTLDAHYAEKSDVEAHQYLMGIAMARNIDDIKTSAYGSNSDFWLKQRSDLHDIDVTDDEIDETVKIADKIEKFSIGIGEQHLPTIAVPKNTTAIQMLRDAALQGWNEKDISNHPRSAEYKARMKHELSDIESAGMAEYFLIIADIVQWAKSQGILMGDGRGSAGGSLTLYLLGVTNLDPIEWGLVWERFYNIGRTGSFPDVDIDVIKERREEVIQYIADKYGEDRVAQLITFNKMTARSVLKDVMRTYGIPFDEANKITALVPEKNDDHQTNISLAEAFEKNPKLQDYEAKYPDVFRVARRLEGRYRGYGTHAAAVIVNNRSFADGNLPLVRDKSGKKMIVGWDMDSIDKLGYLKIDILGLNELDILQETIRLIKDRHGVELDPYSLPMGDEATFELLSSGRTEGIFQLKQALGRAWCKKLKPSSISEISDVIALIRPACLDVGMTVKYGQIKNGEEEESYIDDKLKPILGPTRSVYIYQEQALEMCKLIGMNLKEADIVRKAIGKKKAGLLAAQENKFLNCAAESGFTREFAGQLWDYIKEGAGYGFNKCVSGDTVVIRASANQHQDKEVTIAELWKYYHGDKMRTPAGKKYRNRTHAKLGLRILAMKDGRIKIDRIKDVIKTGIKPVYKMTLDTGHTIKATLDHKFYTDSGWRKLGGIAIGDYVYITGEYEHSKYDYSFSQVPVNDRPFRKNVAYYREGEENTGYINGEFCKWKSARTKMISTIGCCEYCGDADNRLELAHLDGDRTNNDDDNLKLLCVSCHKKYDYLNNNRNRRFDKGYSTMGAKVIDVSYVGQEMTYDIEMCGNEHNYIANGIVTHNSHSTAYALLAYKNAYLKANYPVEFFCANLTMCKNLGDKSKALLRVKEFINDAKLSGITVTPPSLSMGNLDFEILNEYTIAFGLSHIHGVGATSKRLSKECRNCQTFYDFLQIVFKKRINKRAVEGVIRCGAADVFGMPREQMEREYTLLQELPDKEKEFVISSLGKNGILPMIEMMANEDTVEARKSEKIFVPNKNRRAKLRGIYDRACQAVVFYDDSSKKIGYEEKYLGIALTTSFEDMYGVLPDTEHSCIDIQDLAKGDTVELCVKLDDVRHVITKKTKKPMAYLTISDRTHSVRDVVVFPAIYKRCSHILKKDKIIYLKGWYDEGIKVKYVREIFRKKSANYQEIDL